MLSEDRGTVLIAIDTDPNENEQLIRDAWADRGLTERVAIAPQEMTDQLLDAFGPDIVTPPQAPIILIDAEQSSPRLMSRGLKRAEELAEEIERAR